MYSKCGVAPRMTQPRQTTASNRPVSARRSRRLRQLERAGHADHLDIVVARAGFDQRRQRAVAQRLGDRVVEPGEDNRESIAGGASKRARVGVLPSLRTYFPLNSGLRFSRKARVPSRMSSVLATSPKSGGLEALRLQQTTSAVRGGRRR